MVSNWNTMARVDSGPHINLNYDSTYLSLHFAVSKSLGKQRKHLLIQTTNIRLGQV